MNESTLRFHALQPRWIGGARLFTLYLRRGVVYGAQVGGQSRGFLETLALWGEFALVLRSDVRIDRKLDASYDETDPASPGFLNRDAQNFRIASAEIERVVFKRQWHWWLPKIWRRAGLVTFRRRGGGQNRRFLVRRRDIRPLREALASMAFRVDGP